MTTFIICQRCGKPMRPVLSDGTDAPTQGFCSCPPATGWGEALSRQPSMLLDWRDAELARLRAALEQAERERDEARARRDFARDGEENIRFLLKLWQQECDFYRSKCFVREAEIKRQRRTIRALVVAFRDALHLTRRVASDETWDMWLQLVQRQAAERREADRQAGKE